MKTICGIGRQLPVATEVLLFSCIFRLFSSTDLQLVIIRSETCHFSLALGNLVKVLHFSEFFQFAVRAVFGCDHDRMYLRRVLDPIFMHFC